jgi:hypothetical protein
MRHLIRPQLRMCRVRETVMRFVPGPVRPRPATQAPVPQVSKSLRWNQTPSVASPRLDAHSHDDGSRIHGPRPACGPCPPLRAHGSQGPAQTRQYVSRSFRSREGATWRSRSDHLSKDRLVALGAPTGEGGDSEAQREGSGVQIRNPMVWTSSSGHRPSSAATIRLIRKLAATMTWRQIRDDNRQG